MNSTSNAQGEEWDNAAEDGREIPIAHSRRNVVAAAGSLALAASGLFLPGWLVEAEAREGALGGDKGGRRGKNHRGRHKRRTHGHKKDNHKGQDKGRGGDPFKFLPVKFLVNVDGAFPIKTDYYVPPYNPGRKDFWKLQESKSLAPSVQGTFAASAINTALWLEDRILVSADARYPTVKIGSGGAFWAGEQGWQGGRVLFEDGLVEQASSPVFSTGGYVIEVTRLDNDDDYKRLNVKVSRLS